MSDISSTSSHGKKFRWRKSCLLLVPFLIYGLFELFVDPFPNSLWLARFYTDQRLVHAEAKLVVDSKGLAALPAYAGGSAASPDDAWDDLLDVAPDTQAYRSIMTKRIVDIARSGYLHPLPSFCPDFSLCHRYLAMLSNGTFILLAPTVFSPTLITPVLDAGAREAEQACPDFHFQQGVWPRRSSSFPIEDAPFVPTRNFAVYNLTQYLRNTTSHLRQLLVFRAERYVRLEDMSEPNAVIVDNGGMRSLILPSCRFAAFFTTQRHSVSGPRHKMGFSAVLLLEGAPAVVEVEVMPSLSTKDTAQASRTLTIWLLDSDSGPQLVALFQNQK